MTTTRTVRSSDGTEIAFTTVGAGPPLVLVDGAFGSRAFGPNGALAAALAGSFAVTTYDRRGRGTLDGQTHMVQPRVLAPVIAEFLASRDAPVGAGR